MAGGGGDWFEGAGSGQAVDVAELLDGVPMQGVRELVELGALVSIGLTSDGGAVGITVTLDGKYRREYFRKQVEVLAWLGEAVPAIEALTGGRRPSPAQPKRSRRPRSS